MLAYGERFAQFVCGIGDFRVLADKYRSMYYWAYFNVSVTYKRLGLGLGLGLGL